MIFDNCMHSGYSMMPVSFTFDKAGYSNYDITVSNSAHNNSGDYQPDKALTDHVNLEIACQPFYSGRSVVGRGS